MASIDDVKALCDRLAPLGWRDLLLNVTGGQFGIKLSETKKLETVVGGNSSESICQKPPRI